MSSKSFPWTQIALAALVVLCTGAALWATPQSRTGEITNTVADEASLEAKDLSENFEPPFNQKPLSANKSVVKKHENRTSDNGNTPASTIESERDSREGRGSVGVPKKNIPLPSSAPIIAGEDTLSEAIWDAFFSVKPENISLEGTLKKFKKLGLNPVSTVEGHPDSGERTVVRVQDPSRGVVSMHLHFLLDSGKPPLFNRIQVTLLKTDGRPLVESEYAREKVGPEWTRINLNNEIPVWQNKVGWTLSLRENRDAGTFTATLEPSPH